MLLYIPTLCQQDTCFNISTYIIMNDWTAYWISPQIHCSSHDNWESAMLVRTKMEKPNVFGVWRHRVWIIFDFKKRDSETWSPMGALSRAVWGVHRDTSPHSTSTLSTRSHSFVLRPIPPKASVNVFAFTASLYTCIILFLNSSSIPDFFPLYIIEILWRFSFTSRGASL